MSKKLKRVAIVVLSEDEDGEQYAFVRRYPSRIRFDTGPCGSSVGNVLTAVWRAMCGLPSDGRPLGRPE